MATIERKKTSQWRDARRPIKTDLSHKVPIKVRKVSTSPPLALRGPKRKDDDSAAAAYTSIDRP